jgi:hypothetical protein
VQIRRFSLDQLANCRTPIASKVFTYTGPSDRPIHTSVDGACESMYWGMLETARLLRTFEWPKRALDQQALGDGSRHQFQQSGLS